MIKLDVLVIGAGTAGGYAAQAAKRGAAEVGLVEKGQVGGDCIFHACIPTKALVHAARAYKKMRAADFYGLPALETPADYSRVKAFKDKVIFPMTQGRDQRLISLGIKLFRGAARFTGPHEVTVSGETLQADKIIVATGSLPSVPPIPGLGETGYITSIEALELTKVPPRLGIIGGGPIGVEFAQIFAAFGSRVRIYEVMERVLAVEDEEISRYIVPLYQRDGIRVSAGVSNLKFSRTAGGKTLEIRNPAGQTETEEFDEILVATGRKPDIDNLDLTAAGVQFTKKGIVVDASLRTNLPHIWAAGDVSGPPLFTNIAWMQGAAAGANAAGFVPPVQPDFSVLPRATFCDPEVASVGLTEKQARDQGFKVKIGKYEYANITRAIVSHETEGFIKVVADGDSGQILGCHILGSEASTLIHEAAAAMFGKMTYSAVGNTFHSYPTFSEGLRYACQSIQ